MSDHLETWINLKQFVQLGLICRILGLTSIDISLPSQDSIRRSGDTAGSLKFSSNRRKKALTQAIVRAWLLEYCFSGRNASCFSHVVDRWLQRAGLRRAGMRAAFASAALGFHTFRKSRRAIARSCVANKAAQELLWIGGLLASSETFHRNSGKFISFRQRSLNVADQNQNQSFKIDYWLVLKNSGILDKSFFQTRLLVGFDEGFCPEFQNSRIPEFRNSRILECWTTAVSKSTIGWFWSRLLAKKSRNPEFY